MRLSVRFLRHSEIYRSDVGKSQNHPDPRVGAAFRWSAPEPR
jgi:hypothetical protein